MQLPGPIRVLVVERRAVLSSPVRTALSTDPGFSVIGHVASAVEATRVARSEPPDVALCETTLPEPGAVELARFFRVRLPQTRVVFVSPAPGDDELFQAARSGAAAYLSAGTDPRTFLSSLRRVYEGEFLIDEEVVRRPTVARRILSQFRLGAGGEPGAQWAAPAAAAPTAPRAGGAPEALAPLFAPLSAREIEILDLVARGNSNKLIARQLGISDQTVKNHITTILRKLEVNDRTEAVVYALRNGWIRIDAPAPARGPAPARR